MICKYCGQEAPNHHLEASVACRQGEAQDPETTPSRLRELAGSATAARFVLKNPALSLLALEDPDLYDDIKSLAQLYAGGR